MGESGFSFGQRGEVRRGGDSLEVYLHSLSSKREREKVRKRESVCV